MCVGCPCSQYEESKGEMKGYYLHIDGMGVFYVYLLVIRRCMSMHGQSLFSYMHSFFFFFFYALIFLRGTNY